MALLLGLGCGCSWGIAMGQTLCGKSESAIPGIRVEGKEWSSSITACFLNKEKNESSLAFALQMF